MIGRENRKEKGAVGTSEIDTQGWISTKSA